MKVLVTGATGFLGTHVVKLLSEANDVVAITRRDLDLSQPLDTGRLPGAIDAVVHLAQSDRYRDFPGGAKDVFAVNVRSTFDLLEYARERGATHFVLASTGGVYGGGSIARETDPITPRDATQPLAHYLNTKYAAETLAGAYAGMFRTVVLRPFFLYGPGRQEMLVAGVAQRVLDGQAVTVQGETGLRLNPIYVDDAAAAVAAALEQRESGLFNVAGDETVSLTQLADIVGEASGVLVKIERAPGESPSLIADTERMRDVLGVEPQTGLAEGVGRLVEWMRRRT